MVVDTLLTMIRVFRPYGYVSIRSSYHLDGLSHNTGVGAVFISTLAVSKLDQPQSLPRNQEERLAASLHPIVSFVVLGSILIRGSS
jgi:hypothetical protein